jgi:WD40 repeat protein/Mrp family chromosome partitioning ATPase
MILAFYSYKGGVGRTSLALDTAARLALGRDDRPPLRVLVWDLDLDAPGVRHFPALEPAASMARVGTHDLLALLRRDPADGNVGIAQDEVLELLRRAIVTTPEIAEGRLSLLLPAGSETPSTGLTAGETAALFSAGAPGPSLLVLIADLARRELGYDVVVVDARTGINDLAVTATTVLADCAVLVFRLDGQDVAHLHDIVTAIHEAWDRGGASTPDLPNRLYRVANLVPRGDEHLEEAVAQRRAELAAKRLEPHLELPLRPLALVRESIPRLDGTPLDPDADFAVEELSEWAYQRWAVLARRDADGAPTGAVRRRAESAVAASSQFVTEVSELLRLSDWRTTSPIEDLGVDILAEKVGDFGRRQMLLVECKASARGPSVADVERLGARLETTEGLDASRVDAMLVAPRFTPRASEAARARDVLLATPEALLDEQAPSEPLRQRARELWEGTALERQYVEPTAVLLDGEGHATDEVAPLHHHVHAWLSRGKAGMLCVLGDFGAGKTTFCRRLAAELSHDENGQVLPLYVDLRAAGSTAVTLDGLLRHALDEAQIDQPRLAPWRYRLERGSLILLVDGFDELLGYTDPTRMEDLLDELQEAASTTRVLLTSRSGYFRSDQDAARALRGRRSASSKAAGNTLWQRLRRHQDVWAVEVQPFSDAQVDQYLGLRFGTDRVSAILDRLRTLHPVDDLLRRPYLLTLVATSIDQWEERGWPDRLTLTSVYESYVADWLERDEQKHRGLPVDAASLAQHLARVLWDRPGGRIGSRDLRREVSTWGSAVTGRHISADEELTIEAKVRTALFLVRDERGDYGFAHRSFLEFFVAQDLARLLGGEPDLFAVQEALDLARLTPEVAAFLRGWTDSWTAVPDVCQAVLHAEATHPRASANALLLLLWHAQAADSDAVDHRSSVAVEGAQLTRVDLSGANLASARLPGSDLRGANLAGIDLSGAVLTGADLTGALVAGGRLGGAELERVIATQAIFAKADLSGARLEGAHLSLGDFSQASLRGADLSGADFGGARLTGAILEHAVTTGASFRSTRLIGAHLDGTDLTYALLDDADLRFASLRGAHLPPMEGSNVFGARPSPEASSLDGVPVGHLRLQSPRAMCRVVLFDRDVLALGCVDGTVQLWEPESGSVRTLRRSTGAAVRSLCAMTGDGKRALLAIGDEDGTVSIWDLVDEHTIHVLPIHDDKVRAMCELTLPDGAPGLATAHGPAVRLWNQETFAHVATYEGHTSHVRALCALVLPDGSSLLASAASTSILIWDSEGEVATVIDEHTDWVRALVPVPSPDGSTWLASASDDTTVGIWSLDGDVVVRLTGFTDWVRTLCTITLQDGATLLAAAGDSDEIWVWETDTWSPIYVLDHEDWVKTVCPITLGDGTIALASTGEDQVVRVWDLGEGEELTSLTSPATAFSDATTAGDAMPGAAVTLGQDGRAWIWDAAEIAVRRVLRIQANQVLASCAMNLPAGRPGLAVADERLVRIWTLKGSSRPFAVWRPGRKMITALAPLTVDHRLVLAAGTIDGELRIWDVQSGKRGPAFGAHQTWVSGLCAVPVAPGEELLVSVAADDWIYLWDLQQPGQPVRSIGNGIPIKGVVSMPLQSGAPGIVASHADGAIRVWSLDGQLVAEAMAPDGDVTALCLAQSPGQAPAILVGSRSGLVAVWSPWVPSAFLAAYRQDAPVTSLCAVPLADGSHRLVSTGADGVLRLFEARDERLTALVGVQQTGDWMAYREGDILGDGVAAWGTTDGLDRLLLAGGSWTAADVRVTHPESLQSVPARRARRTTKLRD